MYLKRYNSVLAVTLMGIVGFILFAVSFTSFSPAHAQTSTANCEDKPSVESGESHHTLVSHNQRRTYVRYVPEGYDPTQPTPLVLALHGIVSDGEQMRDYTGWNDYADEHNFIVVYPDALFPPSLFVFFPLPEDTPEPVDDVRFIDNLLLPLRHDLCIDNARIYVSGFSAGGAMSLLIACRLSTEIAAVGVMSAPYVQYFDDPTWCAPEVPVPVIAFHGTADTVVSYNGGDGVLDWQFSAFETWTATWAERNGCASTPEVLDTPDTVRGVAYVDCDAEVVAYTIEDGGHAWAGGEPPPGIDPITVISASELMWEFFAQHARE